MAARYSAARYSAAEVADIIGHLRDCLPSSSSCNSALEKEEPVLEGLAANTSTKVRNPSCSSRQSAFSEEELSEQSENDEMS